MLVPLPPLLDRVFIPYGEDFLTPPRANRHGFFVPLLAADPAMRTRWAGLDELGRLQAAQVWAEENLSRALSADPEHPYAAAAQSAARLLYAYTTASRDFQRAGKRVFVIPPRLQAVFGDMDLSEVRLRDVRLPAQTFYIAFPGRLKKMIVGNQLEPDVVADVVGAYVNGLYLADEGTENLGIVIVLRQPDKTTGLQVLGFRDIGSADPDMPVLEWARGVLEKTWGDLTPDRRAQVRGGPEDGVWLLHMLVAMLAYLRCGNADARDFDGSALAARVQKAASKLKNPAKQAEAQREAAALATAQLTVIGPRVEASLLAAESRGPSATTISPPRLGGDSEPARAARSPHLRRGHFHRYRVGPLRDVDGVPIPTEQRETVLHFLEPAWVGVGHDTDVAARTAALTVNWIQPPPSLPESAR